MTTDELLGCVAELGLAVAVSADGRPSLRGDRAAAAPELPALLRVLSLPRHRDEIVRRLRSRPPREFLWPRGQRYVEVPGDTGFGNPDCFPAGAWWWRPLGEIKLRPVPGRPGQDAFTGEVIP